MIRVHFYYNYSPNNHRGILNLRHQGLFLLFFLFGVIFCGCAPKTDETPGSGRVSREYLPLQVGDIITFGQYEQDNLADNGLEPIEWQVLAIEKRSALLISRYALDSLAYNQKYVYTTWNRSALRNWLNEIFYKNAFNEAEQACISQVTNKNPSNPYSRARGGFSTNDRIFLLSLDEAAADFANDELRQCEATAFAKAKGAYVIDNGKSGWWLRSPGKDGHAAAAVLSDGYITGLGYPVTNPHYVVRPAFWLEF